MNLIETLFFVLKGLSLLTESLALTNFTNNNLYIFENGADIFSNCSISPFYSNWIQYYPVANVLNNLLDSRIAPGEDRNDDVQLLYLSNDVETPVKLFIGTFSRSVEVTFFAQQIKWEDCSFDSKLKNCNEIRKTVPQIDANLEIQGCICIASDTVRVMFRYAGTHKNVTKEAKETFIISDDPFPERFLNFGFDAELIKKNRGKAPSIYLQGNYRFWNETPELSRMVNLTTSKTISSLLEDDDFELELVKYDDFQAEGLADDDHLSFHGRSFIDYDSSSVIYRNNTKEAMKSKEHNQTNENKEDEFTENSEYDEFMTNGSYAYDFEYEDGEPDERFKDNHDDLRPRNAPFRHRFDNRMLLLPVATLGNLEPRKAAPKVFYNEDVSISASARTNLRDSLVWVYLFFLNIHLQYYNKQVKQFI